MKLKTLKELKHFGTFAEKGDEYVDLKELKAEAVKWWKEEFGCGDDVCCTCEEMWREFFNITEDDLE